MDTPAQAAAWAVGAAAGSLVGSRLASLFMDSSSKASCLLESWPPYPLRAGFDLGFRGRGSAAGRPGTETTSSDGFPRQPYRGREGAGGPSGLPPPFPKP